MSNEITDADKIKESEELFKKFDGRKVKVVYHFKTGAIMAFDFDGEQISALQAMSFIKGGLEQVLSKCQPETEIHVNMVWRHSNENQGRSS
jgi:hypothetical protein